MPKNNDRVTLGKVAQKLDDLKEYTGEHFRELRTNLKRMDEQCRSRDLQIQSLSEFRNGHKKEHTKIQVAQTRKIDVKFKQYGVLLTVIAILITLVNLLISYN